MENEEIKSILDEFNNVVYIDKNSCDKLQSFISVIITTLNGHLPETSIKELKEQFLSLNDVSVQNQKVAFHDVKSRVKAILSSAI